MASGGGTGCFFASSSASTPASAAPGGGNPFMGLSLFSSSPLAGAGSNGGIFTAAAASCIAGAGDESAGASSAPPASPEEPAPEDPTGKSAAPSPAGEDSAGGEEAAGATQDSLDANTGEEDEEVIFRGECKLWKLVRESEKQRGEEAADAPGADAAAGGSTPSATSASVEGKGWRWQERGCGIVHVNRHQQTGAGRLVMRMRGVLKLLLNTPVFPTTKYERLGQKSVRFVGVDVDDEGAAFVKAADAKEVKMCAYRMSLQGTEKQDEFLSVLRGTLNVASAM